MFSECCDAVKPAKKDTFKQTDGDQAEIGYKMVNNVKPMQSCSRGKNEAEEKTDNADKSSGFSFGELPFFGETCGEGFDHGEGGVNAKGEKG